MRKTLKITGYIVGGVIILLVLLLLLLQSPFGRDFVRQQAEDYLHKKVGTAVTFGSFHYRLPNHFDFRDLYFEDQQGDTLAFIEQLKLDWRAQALLRKRIEAKEIAISGLVAYISRRQTDTGFNYQYLLDAFSGDEPMVKENEVNKDSPPMAFVLDLQKLNLKNCRVRFMDTAGGVFFQAVLKEAFLRPTLINLDKNKFVLNDVDVDGLDAWLMNGKSYLPETEEDTTSTDFLLQVKNVSMARLGFSLLDLEDSMRLVARLGNMKARLDSLDLKRSLVALGNVQIENTQGAFVLGKQKAKEAQAAAVSPSDGLSNPWVVKASALALNQVDFKYDDPNEPVLHSGMDYNHLDVRHLFFNANQVYYSADSLSAELKHLALKEKSGLNLLSLRSQLSYTDHGALLKDLYLETPQTIIKDELAVSYPSLDVLMRDMNTLQTRVKLSGSRVGVNDLLLFLPSSLQSQFLPYKGQVLALDAELMGSLKTLQVKNLMLSGLGQTKLQLNGLVKNASDVNHLSYDLDIQDARSTLTALKPFLPKELMQSYDLPEHFSMNGKVRGTLQDYYPDLYLKSSDGDLSVKGSIEGVGGKADERYDLEVVTKELNLGKILKQDTLLGRVSTVASVKGKSFDPNRIKATVDLNLQSAWIKGYVYKATQMHVELNGSKALFVGKSTDPNLNFRLLGSADWQESTTKATFTLDLKQADLHQLKLMDDTLLLAGKINADFLNLNPDQLQGLFTWQNPVITYGQKTYYLEDMKVDAQYDPAERRQEVSVNLSNILLLEAQSYSPLTSLSDQFLYHLNRHFPFTNHAHEQPAYHGPFDMKGHVVYRPVLKELLPELQPFDSIPLAVGLSEDSLLVGLRFHQLRYGTNRLNEGRLQVAEGYDGLSYHLKLKEATTSMTKLYHPFVGGKIRNDSIYVVANLDDSLDKKQFTLGGAYFKDPLRQELSHFKLFKGLRFDHEIWSIDPQNNITFSPEGLLVNNLKIYKDNQSLEVASMDSFPNAPLQIKVNNFWLSNITQMISNDTLIADGMLMADAVIHLGESGLEKLDGKIDVWGLKVMANDLGNFHLKAETPNTNSIALEASLEGEDNQINLVGTYFIKMVDGHQFDLNLDLSPLNLSRVEGLAMGNIKRSKGQLKGHLHLQGTIDRPIINGDLNTDNLETTVSFLNASFKMPHEKITFDKGKIQFNHFRILDRNGHEGILDGTVYSRDYKNYFLRLDFNAKQWQVLHSKKKDNPEYYGDLWISTNLNLSGAATAPKITGEVTVHDSTDLHYALLDYGPGIIESEGVVRFVDSRDTLNKTDDTTLVPGQRFRISPSTEMNVNVAIDKKAKFTVLMDPATGDELQVSGASALNAYIDPSGTIGLTGTYQVDKGYYSLNYNFLHRKFKIQEGSTISLSGDPFDAEANITAAYDADVAPYDLVKGVASEDQLVYYKQRLPFEVLLKLNGKIMQPDINFDIVLPEQTGYLASGNITDLVQSKLNEIRDDPSDLNKQVFAVLIMNRFLGNDPFASVGDAPLDVTHAAKQTVGRFLSDQLNQMVGHWVQGVDLNLDFNASEDYSSGTRREQTSLNLSASKNLFNDRLKVTIGNNFYLEGGIDRQDANALIPGNIALDYQLSKDGRYQIGAYRTDELQSLIDGYVVETGFKFGLNLSYNKFKYLFINPRKYFAKMRAKRAAEVNREAYPQEPQGAINQHQD